MRPQYVIIFSLTLILAACSKVPSDEFLMNPDQEFTDFQLEVLEGIFNTASEINTRPLDIKDDELSILDELASARMVGLGEATHGSREFFQMKHRIFQYLVEHHDYDAFLFEMDVAEGRIFNDWVQWRRDDDITVLMQQYMLFSWVWTTEEVRDLLEYMRSYNQGKPESNMIGIYGVDTQFPDYDLLQLVDILEAAGIEEAESVRAKNDPHLRLFSFKADQLTEDRLSNFEEGLAFAKLVVIDNQDKIQATLGENQLQWAHQLVRHMEQVQQKYFGGILNNNFGLRDQFMAENTSWHYDLLGQDSKLVLWAHNAHLANNALYAGSGSQGYHLKNEYREDYQIIGFSFAKGDFTARDANDENNLKSLSITEEPLPESSNYVLYHSALENYILPLHGDKSDASVYLWSRGVRPFLSIGALYNGNPNNFYYGVRLNEEYDYIVHFDETTSSRVLAR